MLRHACNDIGLGKRACPELLGDVKIEPITAHGQYETPLYGERLGPEDGLPQSCRLDGRELGLNFSHRTYSRHAREREREGGREGGREGEMYIYIYTTLSRFATGRSAARAVPCCSRKSVFHCQERRGLLDKIMLRASECDGTFSPPSSAGMRRQTSGHLVDREFLGCLESWGGQG